MNASGQTTISDIRSFITRLYKYIHPICFVSGAFVFQDTSSSLFDFLSNTPHQPLGFFTSHDLLLKNSKNNNTDAESRLLIGSMYETSYDDKTITTISCNTCGDTCETPVQREIRIIKWYRFVGNDKGLYIYIKLESSKTFSIQHIANMLSKNVLGKPNVTECKSFREDCIRVSSSNAKSVNSTSDKYCMSGDTRSILLNNAQYEEQYGSEKGPKYGRVGDEYYLGEIPKNYILHEIVL